MRVTGFLSLLLAAAGCSPSAELPSQPDVAFPTSQAAPPGVLTLYEDTLIRARSATLRTWGLNAGQRVYFLVSLGGRGQGVCPPALGGYCLGIRNPIYVLGSDVVDASGWAEVTFQVPANAPLGELWFQASSLAYGNSWLTPPTPLQVQPANTPPVIDSIAIANTPLRAGDTVWPMVLASDPDGDDVEITAHRWFIDDVLVSESFLLEVSFLSRGDVVHFEADVTDGFDTVTATSPSVIVENTPPVLEGVTISPRPASSADTLTCAATTPPTDADGDALTLSWAWLADGQPTGITTPTATSQQAGEVWTCTLTVTDGEAVVSATASVTVAPGTPVDPLAEVGAAFLLDFRYAELLEPAGLASFLAPFILPVDMAWAWTGYTPGPSEVLTSMYVGGSAAGQDVCVPTADVNASFVPNPRVRTEPLTYGHGRWNPITLEDMQFEASMFPGGDLVAGRFSGSMWLGSFVGMLGSDIAQVCSFFATAGASCEACPSGDVACLPVEAVGVRATRVTWSAVPVTEADVALNPACQPPVDTADTGALDTDLVIDSDTAP